MLTKKKFRFSLFDFFLYIFMIIVVLLILLPMIHMLAVSFSSDVYVMQGKVGLWPKGFTAKTYGYVFEDDRIFRSYGNTILYTVLGTTISLSITAMGAYALSAKRMIGHKFFSMMIVFTMFFQGGMIPTYLVVKSYGLLDTIWGVILPGAVSTWNFIVMRSFFDNYPSEIEESGKVDGLTDAGVFFHLQGGACHHRPLLCREPLERLFHSVHLSERPRSVLFAAHPARAAVGRFVQQCHRGRGRRACRGRIAEICYCSGVHRAHHVRVSVPAKILCQRRHDRRC